MDRQDHAAGALHPRSGDPQRATASEKNIVPFKVCGATCDSVDILSRPFWLPETVDTGDWIEIGHIGAYSLALRTRFNGFYPDTFVEVTTPFEEGDRPQGFCRRWRRWRTERREGQRVTA